MNRARIEIIRPDWAAPDHVKAAITTRAGGVSQAGYASLNLASHVGDDPAAVNENRNRLVAALGLERQPAWLNQVHGVDVVHADAIRAPVDADAAFTRTAGVACVVLTADCLPVLFTDRAGRQVAVAHAGWRGLCAGVLQNTLATFTNSGIGLDDIMVWLGPAISQRHYEIDATVRDEFFLRDPECDYLFEPTRPGHWQLDLYRLARRILSGRGVRSVTGGDSCTMSEERFFSYRRERECGRQATLIWLSS
jgi:YfiH family protein